MGARSGPEVPGRRAAGRRRRGASPEDTAYNQYWDGFFSDNPAANAPQILEYGRQLAMKYGFDVNYSPAA